MYYTQETVKQIARDICRENKVCTCVEKDGHCVSIISIAERLAKQGYKPPQKTPKKKRKYFRKCGVCGERYEQSEMIRTNQSSNGWMCLDCYNIDFPEYNINDF